MSLCYQLLLNLALGVNRSVSLKNFALKVIVVIVLTTLPGLSASAAYNDWYKSVLKSLFNAKEACVSVSINSRFFDPLKKGESLEERRKRSPLLSEDEVDKSLSVGGRVSSNITALLSDKLQKNFSIKTVDWRVAPYRVQVNARVIQGLNIYGNNLFEIVLDIDFQEAATTRTGLTDFMSVFHFHVQTFANSKGEVESQIYAALDKAIKSMRKTFSEANEYCASASCKQ